MSRISFASRKFLTTLGLACGLMWCTPALAQSDIFETAAERNIFQAAGEGHFIKARQDAEKLLAENPDSIAANYTMAIVFWQGEGNQLRAMQQQKKALALFEKAYCDETGIPKSSDLQAWHQRMMKDLSRIYAELDNRDEEIRVHERIAELYQTGLSIDATWALIKLGRFDEAREISEQAIHAPDNFYASQAYNNLTAIEDAKHSHLAAYHASQKAYDFSAGKSCVIGTNYARSCCLLLEYDKASELYLKARNAQRDCVISPIRELARLYILDAAWQRAISAMEQVQKQYIEKQMVSQVEMVNRSTLAVLLHAMGFSERALTLMKTVIHAPARLGYDSLDKAQTDMANHILFYAIVNDAVKRQHERLDAYYRIEPFWIFKSDIRERVRELQKDYAEMQRMQWSINQKAFKGALNAKNLKSFILPYYVLDPYIHYAIVDALGRRTAEFMVDYQESILPPEERKILSVIFDHFRAYIAWRDGDLDKALTHIANVERDIKPRMTIMLNQTRLIQADILRQKGQIDKAFEMMTKVYQVFPAAFRHFDVKLPVSFDTSMTETTDEEIENAYKALQYSPRFEETANAPFVISANRSEQMIQICLGSPFGVQYACSTLNPKDYAAEIEDKPMLPEIVGHFLHAVFTPKVDLSQKDLNSLDGSPVQITADQALENLLGVKKRPEHEDEE